MTETTVEPQAPPQETTSNPAPAETSTSTAGKEAEHTAGGYPVVPLSLSGTNTAAGLLATAALAGGPIAAAIAMTGAAVLGTAAAHHRSKDRKKKPAAKTAPAANQATGGNRGRIPSQPRSSPRTGGGSGSRRSTGGQARPRAAGTTTGGRSAGRSGASVDKTGTPSARQRASQAAGRLAGGRAGQVRDLRAQAKTQAPTRSAARTAAVQARRQVADTRRAAKAADRATSAGTKARGPAARTLAKPMGKAAAARDKAVGATRAMQDRNARSSVANGRTSLQEAAHRRRVTALQAPARKTARKALRRSAARFQARRALSALLGAALGVLGMVTTPLGRKLGWRWLMFPGRRLYAFLVGRALAEREARDEEIRAQLEEDERAAEEQAAAERDQDTEGDRLGDRAARPTKNVPAPPASQGAHSMSTDSGFRFEELAAEMEQAAQQYEPESAMEILAMIEGLPEALTSIANVMQILAERSDTEFPLEKVVADGFADIYGAINSAVAVAEDLGPAFRQAHEADIARHEDPRNGPEAEKGWNV
nr:hypothetical protein OG409_25855 [Streptomyces sp. NBC_00974]